MPSQGLEQCTFLTSSSPDGEGEQFVRGSACWILEDAERGGGQGVHPRDVLMQSWMVMTRIHHRSFAAGRRATFCTGGMQV